MGASACCTTPPTADMTMSEPTCGDCEPQLHVAQASVATVTTDGAPATRQTEEQVKTLESTVDALRHQLLSLGVVPVV